MTLDGTACWNWTPEALLQYRRRLQLRQWVVCNLRREHSYGRHHLVDAAAAHPPHPLRSPPSRWRLTSENRALWRVPASSLSHPFPAPTCLFQTIEVAIFGRVAGSEARWCSVAGTTGYRHVAPDQRRVPSPLQQTIHQSQTTQDTVRHEG